MHPHRLLGLPLVSCALIVALGSGLAGCGTQPIPGSDLGSAVQSGGAVAEDGQSNNLFAQAQQVPLPAIGEVTISGSINGRDDIDLYDLGPVAAGNRVVVDVRGNDGLNTVAAIFNAGMNLIDANNDRSYYAGQLDPYIARVIRADTDHLYLGIAVSSSGTFTSSSGQFDSGTYTVTVRRDTNIIVPQAKQQVVWLDFEGGDRVQIGLEPFETMRPFSVESFSPRLAGSTERIIDIILEHMREDYAQFNVVLLDSRHHTKPAEPYSKLYFGNYSSRFLGLADSVDTGNALLQQEAIIYAEDMALFENLLPDENEFGLALANVAAHELGHLLGLEHTARAPDLLATAATARQILEIDHGFYRMDLQSLVFPAGYQDCPGLLLQNVGLNPSLSASDRIRRADAPSTKLQASWRDMVEDNMPSLMCGTCGSGFCNHDHENGEAHEHDHDHEHETE